MSAAVTPFARRTTPPVRSRLDDRVAIVWDRFVLPNGLTVIVQENRAVPLVTVNIWYKVGTKDEVPGKTGLAHLFEHLMFGGSANMPGPYLDNMGQVGAIDMNGTTNPDRTNFYQTVETGALDAALFAESDRMGHFLETLGSVVLEQQRGVVLNEKLQTEGGPYGKLQECVALGLYPPDHPYGHTTLGWQEDIETLTLEDAHTWFRNHYAPSNAVLVLAGDIDLATARAKAAEFFGHIPPGPPQRRPMRWVPAPRGERRETIEDRVPRARVTMVWHVPPAGDPDCTRLSLAIPTFAQTAAARLHMRLVERDQLAVDAAAGLNAMLLSGQFVIAATLADGADIDTMEAAIRDELASFCREGPSADELDRTIINAEARLIRQLQTSQAVADVLAMNEVYFGDPGRYQAEMEWIADATVEEVRATLAKLLDRAPDYVLHTVPHGDLRTEGDDIDRSLGPIIDAPRGIALPQVHEARLSNGVRVLLAERHDLPLVNCKLIVPRGATLEPRDRMGVASMTAGLMMEGAGQHDREAFRDLLDQNAIGTGAAIGADFSGVGLSTLRSRFDLGLDLQAEVVRRPRFDREDIERVRAMRVAGLRGAYTAAGAAAQRIAPALLFGTGNDYARLGEGLPDTLAAIDRDDLVAMHRRVYDPTGATFMVVGDVTLDEVLPKLEARYGDWNGSCEAAVPVGEPARPVEPGIYMVDCPGAVQTTLVAATLIPAAGEIDPVALEIVDMALGGSFGSRLNMNLREDKNWTYGIRTEIGSTRGARAYVATGAVQADRTGDAMVEILREYRDIVSSRPIEAGMLAGGKQGMILGLPQRIQTLDSLLGSIEALVRRGHPLDYWSHQADRIDAVDLDTVNALARRIIRPDRLIWIVAGDRRVIEADVVRTGIGPVHHVASGEDIFYR